MLWRIGFSRRVASDGVVCHSCERYMFHSTARERVLNRFGGLPQKTVKYVAFTRVYAARKSACATKIAGVTRNREVRAPHRASGFVIL
jgi:hypothetical protein